MGQHYVPKFYLRGFARGDRFFVFDKKLRKWFQSQPKSVANEINLWPDELEVYVTKNIEEPAKNVIEKLRNKLLVNEEERYALARYIAFLWKRVPAGRERVRCHTPLVAESVRQELHATLDAIASEDDTKAELVGRRRGEIDAYIEKIKLERPAWLWHSSLTVDSGLDLGRGIVEMNWRVLHTDEPRYLASDNPVFFFEADGVGNATSELTLALSSTAALVGTHPNQNLPLHCVATESAVREINRRTSSNTSRYVFSEHVEPWMQTFLLKGHHVLTRRAFHNFIC